MSVKWTDDPPDDLNTWMAWDATDRRNLLITWASVMTLIAVGVIW